MSFSNPIKKPPSRHRELTPEQALASQREAIANLAGLVRDVRGPKATRRLTWRGFMYGCALGGSAAAVIILVLNKILG